MYAQLGVHWATSLLGFLAVGMAIIPFVFIKFGPKIRAHSKFCQALLKAKEDAARRSDDNDEYEEFPATGDDADMKV